MLDYVYRNRSSGITPLGKLIDWSYLNAIGWKGIRLRKENLERLLARAIAAHVSNPAALQVVVYALVAVAGLLVVLERNPLRQSMIAGAFGMCLAVLFLVFQAPDVALSEIVVSTIGLPFIILAALRKIHEQDRARKKEEEAK